MHLFPQAGQKIVIEKATNLKVTDYNGYPPSGRFWKGLEGGDGLAESRQAPKEIIGVKEVEEELVRELLYSVEMSLAELQLGNEQLHCY